MKSLDHPQPSPYQHTHVWLGLGSATGVFNAPLLSQTKPDMKVNSPISRRHHFQILPIPVNHLEIRLQPLQSLFCLPTSSQLQCLESNTRHPQVDATFNVPLLMLCIMFMSMHGSDLMEKACAVPGLPVLVM